MTPGAIRTFIASFLGWTLDAFDFFLVIVVVPHLADDFHTSIVGISVAVTLTLAMRPVGAFIFGWFADRYGRRLPLMIDIALYSLIELATAFAPNLGVFIALRVIFGVAMGGEWGLGAALAMESLPAHRRGLFSGILQEGYAVGNLLAGVALALLYTHIGWRGMFVVGALPAFLIFFIRAYVPESPAWLAKSHERAAAGGDVMVQVLRRYWPLFGYGMLFMASFNFMSHATQDGYATFLTRQHGFSPQIVGTLNAVASGGAILGGIVFGAFSQRIGRRNAIVLCAVLAAFAIPLWVFSQTVAMLALGGFVMQCFVQGAWGIIPAHLNEIAPPLARGTFPGFTYQLGNLLAAGTLQLEAGLASGPFAMADGRADYARAMAVCTVSGLLLVIVFTLIGRAVRPEARHEAF